MDASCRYFASASRDTTVRIWDGLLGKNERVLGGHTGVVSSLCWTSNDYIISGSHDKSICVFKAMTGELMYRVNEHKHWVNSLSLSNSFLLKTAFNDPNRLLKYSADIEEASEELKMKAATERINTQSGFRLVSCSDDFKMVLWETDDTCKLVPMRVLHGHQKTVAQVSFSCDGSMIASCSFDKSVRVWDGWTGAFLMRIHNHLGAV